MERDCLMSIEFQFGKMKDFRRWIVVTVHNDVMYLMPCIYSTAVLFKCSSIYLKTMYT